MVTTAFKTAHPFDIKIGDVPLFLDPTRDKNDEPLDKEIAGKFSPVNDTDAPSDVPALWADWSLGIGIGRTKTGLGGSLYGLGVCTRRPGMAMSAPKKREAELPDDLDDEVRIVDYLDYGSNTSYLLTSGNQILKATGGVLGEIEVIYEATTPSFAGKSLIAWRGSLFASGGTGLVKFDGSSWTEIDIPIGFMAKVDWYIENRPRKWLLGVFSDTTFRRTDNDPMSYVDTSDTGDWSVATTVGDGTYPVTSITGSNRVAVFMTPAGPQMVDSAGYSTTIASYWEETIDAESGSVSLTWNGKVYGNHAGTLDQIDVADRKRLDEATYVHPGLETQADGPIFGDVTALAPDRSWLACAIDNGTNSYLMHGKSPEKLKLDLSLGLVWQGAEAWWENQYVTKMKASNKGTRPHFVVATYDRETDRARLWALDRYKAADPYQAWKQGEDIGFESHWSLFYVPDTYGEPGARKVPIRGDVNSQNLSTERYLDIFARVDATQPVQEDDDGNDLYTLIAPLEGTFTLTLGDFGTTSALSGVTEATPATADDIKAALEALDPDLVGVVDVSGTGPFVVTVPDGEVLTTSAGSLDWWLQGTASTSPRQTFLPSTSVETGFSVAVRIDGHGSEDGPTFVEAVQLRSSVLRDQVESVTYPIRFGKTDNLAGSPDIRDADAVKSQLEAYMGQGPVEVIEEGRVYTGKVQPGLSYTKKKSTDGWEARAVVKVSVMKRPFYWDTGAFWDDVFVWGSP